MVENIYLLGDLAAVIIYSVISLRVVEIFILDALYTWSGHIIVISLGMVKILPSWCPYSCHATLYLLVWGWWKFCLLGALTAVMPRVWRWWKWR